MHTEYPILQVTDTAEYKLSKLIHSLITDSPRLPEVLCSLIVPTNIPILSIQEILDTNTKFTANKKRNQLEKGNSNADPHEPGTNIQTTSSSQKHTANLKRRFSNGN